MTYAVHTPGLGTGVGSRASVRQEAQGKRIGNTNDIRRRSPLPWWTLGPCRRDVVCQTRTPRSSGARWPGRNDVGQGATGTFGTDRVMCNPSTEQCSQREGRVEVLVRAGN